VEAAPLSIDSLIERFGIALHIYNPVYTTGSDGSVVRTFGRVVSQTGFVQPSSQSEPFAQGRQEGRTSAQIFFPAGTTVRIDSEIYDGNIPSQETVRKWRVIGSTNPGELQETLAAPHLSMTVVDAVEIEPEIEPELEP
jgi:hypothetical protein